MPQDPIPREREEALQRNPADLYNRLHFLHWAIEDTQETVRFLDTKAAFCVTLLSGMVAVSIDHPLTSPFVKHVLLPVFLLIVVCSLLVCLRVIFPIVIPHGSGGPPASPKFFIGHNKAHHWLRHTLRNPRTNVLSETHHSYLSAMHVADDNALLSSMSETAVTLAFIRQIKSDRLHSAMFCLAAAIFMFAAIMLVQV